MISCRIGNSELDIRPITPRHFPADLAQNFASGHGQLLPTGYVIEPRGGIMDRRVQRVISLMQDDLRQELTLCQRAQAVNLTASHLCRLFKAETGVSPSRYLKILRIHRAKNLLETTFLNVKEIMNKVGVKDESHFVRDFKIICGLTPAQHRVSFRTMLENENILIPKTANDNQNRPINAINRQ